MTAEDQVRETLAQQLRGVLQPDALVAYGGDGDPDVIAVDRGLGLVAIDIDVNGYPSSSKEPIVRLNRKISGLAERVPAAGEVSPHRLIAYSSHQQSLINHAHTGSMRALGRPDVETGDWPKLLIPRPVDPVYFEEMRAGFAPALCFEVRAHGGAADPGRAERRLQQIMLDTEQAEAVQGPVDDVLQLTGPPGSGKTLVLAGRARHLALKHPKWRIVMLCYNNALLPYLRHLVAGYSNVEVTTFAKFSYGEGHRFSLRDDAEEAANMARARRKGIQPTVDALLIDEAQDFRDAWVSFALATLRAGRGGAVIAGDDRQALYENSPVARALAGRQSATLRLEQPYRSTRQILEVASITQPAHDPLNWDGAPRGESVHLIHADSWDEQAAAAAWEIRRLIDYGKRCPKDIAVLVTKRIGTMTRMAVALEAQGVPHLIVNRENAGSFDPASPEVKVMTVNAAKGHEFDVVVLLGLDTLAEPPAPGGDPDPKHGRWGNAGYVGMTRARDLLLIPWTKHANPHVRRLRHLADTQSLCVQSRVWPEDYR